MADHLIDVVNQNDEIEKEMAETPDNFCQGFRNDFNQVKEKLRSL